MAFFKFILNIFKIRFSLSILTSNTAIKNIFVFDCVFHYFLVISIDLIKLLSFFIQLLSDIFTSIEDWFQIHPLPLNSQPNLNDLHCNIQVVHPLSNSLSKCFGKLWILNVLKLLNVFFKKLPNFIRTLYFDLILISTFSFF